MSLPRSMSRRLAPLLVALCTACGSGGSSSPPPPPPPPGPNPAATVAANSTTLTSIDPATSGDSDLAAFGAAVGDRRIVLLTEATHGDGATFQLKTRLVKYLHETKGFDVLFIESGMYDVTRIQQRLAAGGDSISVQAPGRIFYMYSRTDLGQQMLKYVDQTRATATPLEPWGDDVPMNGVDSVQSLLANLQAFLVAHHSTLPQGAGWAGWLRVAQQSVALVKTTPISSVDSASFLSLSPALIAELCSQADTPGDLLQSPAYWCRIAKGVQADYTHLWSATDVRTPTDLRDITAAGNIEWALDGRLAGRKAIVWLHAIHGDNGFAGLGPCAWAASQECGPGWTNVGTDLRRAYGDQVYIANITAGGGTYDTYNTASSCGAASPGFVLATPGSNSLEYYLGAGGQPRFMASPADAAGRQRIASLTALEEEFNMATPSHFGSAYQGLFYLPRLAHIGTNCAAFPVVAYP